MASHIRGAHSGQYASWAAARKSGAVTPVASPAPKVAVSASDASGFSGIIAMLQQQGAAIDSALAALRGVGTPAFSAPPAPATAKSAAKSEGKPRGGKRKLSPEGRARLIEALKRRWAKQKSEPVVAAPRKRGRPRKVQA